MTTQNQTEQIHAPGTSETFLRAMDMVELSPPAESVRTFQATTQWVPWPKAYGGDMVAQALMAMMRTVSTDRAVHSTHSYFMRPVDISQPVTYHVELLRDGRNFSTREVRAMQNDKTAYISMGSFQVPSDGDHFSQTAPKVLTKVHPETLPSASEVLEGHHDDAAQYWATGRSFDMRHVQGAIYRGGVEVQEPAQAVWIRAFDPLTEQMQTKQDQDLHRAGLAYVCDYTILESLLRQRGLAWGTEGLVTASLDHSMWFHRPGRVDDWILYVQEAVSAQSQRGLATGNFYARTGELVASVAQEGMIRA
jgi:acyl-CoA thioesterase II